MNVFEERNINIFNSPLEIGLRVLYILDALNPVACDMQRLIYYDYILVHSNDVADGPLSIHPNIPHRTSEILVKRDLIKKGLTLMHSRELVKCIFDSTGILYSATDLTRPFLAYNTSEYSLSLKDVSAWLISKFQSYSDEQLSSFIKSNMDIWGGEFSRESLLRGYTNE